MESSEAGDLEHCGWRAKLISLYIWLMTNHLPYPRISDYYNTCPLTNDHYLQAKFRGPRVTIDADPEDPALDFGYIHYQPGCTVQRQFDIINNDGVEASWNLREMEHCINADYVS